MAKRKNRSEMVKEADDIIKNTIDDDAAIQFLQETWVDDYPDLDLGRMDLHEAIDELDYKMSKKKMSAGQRAVSDLNRSLDEFMKNHDKMKRKSEANKRKRKKKR